MTLLPFLKDILISNFEFFSKKSIFFKFSNCRIIIAQTTYFENIQYCKIYFHYGLGLTKTSYNDSASFFGRYSHFKFRFFWKMSIFFKFSNCRIIIAQTSYFENIQNCKIYFHYGLGLAKTSYKDCASFFWKIFSFKISVFIKIVHFSQVFKLPHNYSPNYLFWKHPIM